MRLFILTIFSVLVVKVVGHGRLTVPPPRDAARPTYLQDEPSGYDSDFICRNAAPITPPPVTLQGGGSLTVQWSFGAAHVGDCFLYLSYDDQSVSDANRKWFKITELPDCKSQNNVPVTVTLPEWLPSCSHCVLRWEWYALHVRPNIEFYAQCVDVVIEAKAGAQTGLPAAADTYVIPGHLPTDGNQYRNAFDPNSPQFLTGPPLAVPNLSGGGGPTPTNPCSPNPCKNAATCTATSSSAFRCDCTADFTGALCDRPVSQDCEAEEYTVVAGDTLYAIAAAHGITLEQLLASNPQITDPTMIFVGDVITIPCTNEPTKVLPKDPSVTFRFDIEYVNPDLFLTMELTGLSQHISDQLHITNDRVSFSAAVIGSGRATIAVTIAGNVNDDFEVPEELTAQEAYELFVELANDPDSTFKTTGLGPQINAQSIKMGAASCPSGSGDDMYTAGDIAGTFFGTLLGTLAICGAIYYFGLRQK